jgi:hypothetical protein
MLPSVFSTLYPDFLDTMNDEGTRFHTEAKPASRTKKVLFRLRSTPVENLCIAAQNKIFISQTQENYLKQ